MVPRLPDWAPDRFSTRFPIGFPYISDKIPERSKRASKKAPNRVSLLGSGFMVPEKVLDEMFPVGFLKGFSKGFPIGFPKDRAQRLPTGMKAKDISSRLPIGPRYGSHQAPKRSF